MKKFILPLIVGLSLSTATFASNSAASSHDVNVVFGNGTVRTLIVDVGSPPGKSSTEGDSFVVRPFVMKNLSTTTCSSTYVVSACIADISGNYCVGDMVTCFTDSPTTVIAQILPSTGDSLRLYCSI